MRLAHAGPLTLLLTLASAGCDGTTAPPASPDAGLALPYEIPWLADGAPRIAQPLFTPCPDGWRPVTDGNGLVTCEPWPETGYDGACAAHEAHFAGTPGCAPLGTDCPADGWPEGLPDDRVVVYVDDDAPAGGDGTARASAYRSIHDAVLFAPRDAIIAVAVGHYDDEVALVRGELLWGACTRGVELTTSDSDADLPALRLDGPGAAARNLSVHAPDRFGVWLAGDGPELSDVVVSGAWVFGVLVASGSASIRGLVVRDTRSAPASRDLGYGIALASGAHLSLERAVLERNHGFGIEVHGAGSLLTARDVVIRETLAQESDGTLGDAIAVTGGAEAVLSVAILEHMLQIAVAVEQPGSRLTATDVVVRDTDGRADGTVGRAFDVEAGGQLVLERVVAERSHDVALFALGPASAVEARDLVVRDTQPQASDGARGRGIELVDAIGLLERVHVVGNREYGIVLGGAAAAVRASDLVVRDTRSEAVDLEGGRGIGVQLSARLVLDRALLAGNHESGLFVAGDGAWVDAHDLVVRDTEGRESDGAFGSGITVEADATLLLERALLERNRESSLLASGELAVVEARDVLIRDTRAAGLRSENGAGVWAQLEARVALTGARVERSRFIGIAALNGGVVELATVEVAEVSESECAGTTCPELAGGFGISAQFGASVVATDFLVEDVALCGVVVGAHSDLFGRTRMELANGVLTRAPIGACVQAEGFDASQLQHGVDYRDVDVPLRATTYALPAVLPHD